MTGLLSSKSSSLTRGGGPVVISLAAGLIALVGGLLVNACRINKLLGGPGSASGTGGGVIIIDPAQVRDSALAGSTTPRVTNVAVMNGGGWTAEATESWIDLKAVNDAPRGSMRLSLDPKSLPPGLHHGQVTIRDRSDDSTSATLPVTFRIQQPVLELEPDKFEYRARTSSSVFRDTIEIINEGDGPLVWTATTEHHSGWLRFESDTTGTAPSVLAIRASNEGLGYFGTFRETIIVSSPGAKNSPKKIEVSIRRQRGGGDHDHDDDDDAGTPPR